MIEKIIVVEWVRNIWLKISLIMLFKKEMVTIMSTVNVNLNLKEDVSYKKHS